MIYLKFYFSAFTSFFFYKKFSFFIFFFYLIYFLFFSLFFIFPGTLTDIDNNGVLEQHDFECMALKMTLIEGKGDFNYNRYQENLHIMLSLWEEIAELADFNKVNKQLFQLTTSISQQSILPSFLDNYSFFPYPIIFFFKDGVVTVEEFKKAVQKSCVGRAYRDFPQAMKMFIDSHFKLVDINGEK